MIFYTRSCAHLEGTVGLPCGTASFEEYNSSELLVRIHDDVVGKPVIVCATTTTPESWLETFFLIDALQRAGARVSLLLGYSGYGRQDRDIANQSSGMQVMQRFLSSFPLENIVVVHAHNTYAWDIPGIRHVLPLNFFGQHVRDSDIIVAPDNGAQGLATALAAQHQKECLVLNKVRLAPDRVRILNIAELDVRGKRCVIVDDMVTTAATIVAVADALSAHGASTVTAVATHGLFVDSAYKKIQDSSLAHVFVTNTVHHTHASSRVCIVDIGGFVRQLCTEIFKKQ